jgi:hypothetical protein
MQRKDVATRIRALLSKTVENGCSEAEALAAALKARELLDAYQLELSDVELEAEGIIQDTAEKAEDRQTNVQWELGGAVADFCEVRGWFQSVPRGGKRICTFHGLRSDVEFARWLIKALEVFVWQQADAYALQEPGRAARRSFVLACCGRIRERLQLETDLRHLKPAMVSSTGRSVALAKKAIVTREFEKLNLKLRVSSLGCGGGSDAAAAAGRAAGGKAGFGRPVNSGGGMRAIGKR